MVRRFKKEKLTIKHSIKKIVVTGPESTGKSVLSRQLAERYNCVLVPEYAREYIGKIDHQYTTKDVEHIAKHQLEQERDAVGKSANGIVIFDTWFILTKVWFDVVFGECPKWVTEHIRSTHVDLFLVCYYDLPWIPDPVRENGGVQRKVLFERYCKELESFGYDYVVVKGEGDTRKKNAIEAINSFL